MVYWLIYIYIYKVYFIKLYFLLVTHYYNHTTQLKFQDLKVCLDTCMAAYAIYMFCSKKLLKKEGNILELVLGPYVIQTNPITLCTVFRPASSSSSLFLWLQQKSLMHYYIIYGSGDG